MIVQMLILRMMLNVIVGSLYDVILCVRLFGSLQRGASQVFFPPEVLFIFFRDCALERKQLWQNSWEWVCNSGPLLLFVGTSMHVICEGWYLIKHWEMMNIVLFFLMPNSLNYGIDLTSSKCYNLRFPSCLNIEDVQFPSSSNKTPRFFLHREDNLL